MPPTTTGAAARPSGAHSVFVQDEIAAFPFLEAADVKKHHKEQLRASSERVISSSYAAPPAADNEGAASTWEVDATVPSIDRVYKYGRHFKLDEPFTLRLRKGETVLLPLEPIHDLLFPSSIASTTNSTTQEKEQATSPLAIGLELSNCQGRVQSFIVRKSDRASRFSTASYQCVTISHASKAQQQRVNLCPHYDPQFPVALFEDPSNIKGFLLRADVDEPVESIVLLRSTKSSGGFEKAFVVPDDDDDDRPSQSPFNVSFSYEATTLGFESPSIWDHSNDTPNESLLSSELKACEACEYFLYAEKLTTNQTVHTVAADFVESSSTQLALPYCIRQRSSVQYQLPKLIASTSSSTSDGKIHHRHNVKLDDLFADHFRSSGEYRFVLMASLPSSANHQHPAMLAYAPQQLVVTGELSLIVMSMHPSPLWYPNCRLTVFLLCVLSVTVPPFYQCKPLGSSGHPTF